MSALVGRPEIRPRLPVGFSTKDLLAYLGGRPNGVVGEWPPTGSKAYFLTSGRASLHLILKSLRLPPGSRVGLPLFVCEAVPQAIVRSGHHPVFLDVDPATMLVSASSIGDAASLDAFVAVHLFGNPVDIDSLGLDRATPVIEDCAHALCSEARGNAVGTRGVAAMYSFGLGKPISIGRLGAAVFSEQSRTDEVEGLVQAMPQESRSASVYGGIRSFLISALYRRPWYGMFSLQLGLMLEQSIDPMGHHVSDYEAPKARLQGLVRSKIHSYRARLRKQRQFWHVLSDAMADGSADTFVPQETERDGVSDQWLFAIRCSSTTKRDALADTLLKSGIDSMKMYDQVPEMARLYYGYRGDAIEAEKLCHTVLGIPVLTADATTVDFPLATELFKCVRAVR